MKRTIIFITALFLLLLFSLPQVSFASGDLDYVTDQAGILSDDEWMELEERAEQISNLYECDIRIISVDDFVRYVSEENRYDILAAAEEIYTDYNLGYGEDRSGLLLLLSMDDRDFALLSHGYGTALFTDYRKDAIIESFLDNFADDDWFGGFQDYIDTSEAFLELGEPEPPADRDDSQPADWGREDSDYAYYNPQLRGLSILISIGLGLLIAAIISILLRRSMRSVFRQAAADAYVDYSTVNITLRDDRYSHSTEVRVKIEKKESSSSSGRSSGGFSGRSGKF